MLRKLSMCFRYSDIHDIQIFRYTDIRRHSSKHQKPHPDPQFAEHPPSCPQLYLSNPGMGTSVGWGLRPLPFRTAQTPCPLFDLARQSWAPGVRHILARSEHIGNIHTSLSWPICIYEVHPAAVPVAGWNRTGWALQEEQQSLPRAGTSFGTRLN